MFPLLLADDGSIISLIVVIVGIIGWIVNLASGKTTPQQPPPRPKPRREANDDIFIQDEPRKQKSKKQKGNAGQPARQQEARPPSRRPVGEIAQRHIQTSNLGAGVRSHLSESLTNKVDQAVQEHLKPRVEDSVKQHLGAFTAAVPAPPQNTNAAVAEIIQALRAPNSVRQAIIVSTILARPNHKPRT